MLTKTNFMNYIKCPVYLWMLKHKPDLIPEDSSAKRRIFEMGREVDDFSRKLFEGGVEVKGFNKEGWQNTQKFVAGGSKILFQPTAFVGELTCRADILEKNKKSGAWTINEVKAATTVKKKYPYDLAFQKICFENAGVEVANTNLIHINNKYIRHGKIDPKDLFVSEDITDTVLEKIPETKKIISQALAILQKRAAPDKKLLDLCSYPRSCEYLKIYLESIGQKVGGIEIEPTVDPAGISEKLMDLEYPLYFLDYETYSSAIPLFDGTRPYQNIPFQYSLLMQESRGTAIRHTEFLAREFKNPVPKLLSQLKRDLGSKGSVIVWNMPFEKGCNDEMARMEPEFADFLRKINARIFDLMIIFKLQNQLYVKSEFEGSHSLKKVLPVLCPELSYKSLSIQEGLAASLNWPILTSNQTSESEKARLIKDMLEYCKRDTEAMVCILERLKRDVHITL